MRSACRQSLSKSSQRRVVRICDRYTRSVNSSPRSGNKKGPAAPRAPLRARDVELHLDDKVGTVQVVTTTGDKQAGGYVGSLSIARALLTFGSFFCDVCQCTVRDSTNYVDHLNGKRRACLLGGAVAIAHSA